MVDTKTITKLLGVCVTILLVSGLSIGQVKIDEDQIFTNGGYERRVNYACEGSLLHAECEPGNVIRFLRGNFGRAETDTCYHDFTSQWNCRSNSSEQIMRARCNQKPSCSIEASNKIFGDPCPYTKKYAEIQYHCVPGKGTSKPQRIEESVDKASAADARRVIYGCESSPVYAECEEGYHIRILQARYGRSNLPTCYEDYTDDWYCTANSTERIVREKCDKEDSCSIEVSNEIFGDPCPYNLKYLEVVFTCDSDTVTFTRTPSPPPTKRRTTPTTRRTTPTTRRTTPEPVIPITTEIPDYLDTDFDERTQECDENDLECLRYVCPEGTGNFPHPTNDNLFIFCMNWKPKVDSCGKGLVFLERFSTCFSENSLYYIWMKTEQGD